MSKKMPDIVRNNQIYSFIWNLIYEQKNNAVLLFIGDVGKGKSTGAIRFGTDLDEKFSVDRICFDMKEFLNLITNGDRHGKLRRGSAIIFDEPGGAEMGIDSRTSLSPINVRASKFSTISRAKGFIIIYCVPQLKQLDKRVRSIGVKGICNFKGIDFKAKRSKATFYYNFTPGFGSKSLNPQPRTIDKFGKKRKLKEISIPLPRDAELIDEYEDKKDEFINASIAKWHKLLERKDEIKQGQPEFLKQKYGEAKIRLHEITNKKGEVSVPLIRIILNVGIDAAKHIKSLLKEEGITGVTQ